MSNSNYPPGLTAALAALYGALGASSYQDTRDTAVAAQSFIAPFAQQPTAGQVLSARSSSSPFDIQSLYARQVQQLANSQQVDVQQTQQQQAQNPTAILSSLPPNLLQAYLAVMTSKPPPSLSGMAPFIGTNVMSYQQTSQQLQENAQAQAIAAQIRASSINQSNPGIGTQRPLPLRSPNATASILSQGTPAGELIGQVAQSGPAHALESAGNNRAPALLYHSQIAAQSVHNTSPSSDSSTSSVAHIAPPAAKTSGKSSSPSVSPFDGEKAKLPSRSPASSSSDQSHHTPNAVISEWEDKKSAKRAANRLSAHLSRKRKKMFIDDLTAENRDLRRKVKILQTIPDLIVVFDSRGCISFISQSVSILLDVTNRELEGTSFWDCLAEDSVKMVKSAFMDALAEKRKSEGDPTPLCHGESLLVTLVDKNARETRAVSLKGVVHVTGVAPECVCSIRPIESGLSNKCKGHDEESQDHNVNTFTGGRTSQNLCDG